MKRSRTAAATAAAEEAAVPEETTTAQGTAPGADDAGSTSTPQASPAPAQQAAEDAAPAPATDSPSADDSAAETAQGAAEQTADPADLPQEDSPVVDVEPVEYTPARERSADEDSASADSIEAEPAADETEESERSEAAAHAPSAESQAPAVESAVSAEQHAARPEQDDDAEEHERTPVEGQGLLSVPGAEFAEIPIHEVRENPRNPRTMFDEDELDELAYSLREVGVLQPVVVRPIPVTEDGESFELVMGERRWRAARRAGLTSIPAIIRETSDDDLLRDALLENLHRTQLNPLEEANAYQQLLDDFGCTQDELGDRIGRSRPQITNTLRLLRLPALVQRRLASGAISAGHARALLSLDDPTLMEELAQRIVSEGLSVRAVERLVARGGQQQQGTRTVRRSTYDPHVVDLTSRLSNRLEAPVRIDVGKRKGKITLEFTNLEDLERLVESMGLDIPMPEQN